MTPSLKVCGDFALCWRGECFKRGSGMGGTWNVERNVKEAGRIIGVSGVADFGPMYIDLLIQKFHIMFWMMWVVHFTIDFQVTWLTDQGACVYLLLSNFVPQGIQHHNTNCKRRDVKLEKKSFVIFVVLSAHVCNLHFGCYKTALDLTWLEMYKLWGICSCMSNQ